MRLLAISGRLNSMDIDVVTILVGLCLIIVLCLVRIVHLKKRFLEKKHMYTTIGKCVVVASSTMLTVKAAYFTILTITGKLTAEILLLNKSYIAFFWIILISAGIVSYFSLFLEEKE